MECQSDEAQSSDSDAGKADEYKITFLRKILPEPCEQKITKIYVIVDADEYARITGATEAFELDIDDLLGCILYIGMNK